MFKCYLAGAAMSVALVDPLQAHVQAVVEAQRVDRTASVLPANTPVVITPAEEISSIDMKEGTQRACLVVKDVVYNGAIVSLAVPSCSRR